MNKSLKLLILILSFSLDYSIAQVAYEPFDSEIYNFLERLSSKGIIEINDLIKPLPRKYIYEKLIQVELNSAKLTQVEKENLHFYLKDFNIEYNDKQTEDNIIFFQEDKLHRWRLFSFTDEMFKVNISPIIGLKIGSLEKGSYLKYSNGFKFYGYLANNLGFDFNFRDNHEEGKNIDAIKDFSPETGIIINDITQNTIEFSEVRANITYNWNWGNLTFGKDFLNFGYGRSGNLVLSSKAPSFPYLRLDIAPVKWFSFNYIHAKLASDVLDSNETYKTTIDAINFDRTLAREKYYVSHTLSISPLKGLSFSIGESIIYSDRFEMTYLIPILFFKATDHYLSKYRIGEGDNAQFYFNISSKNQFNNIHLYSTLFIDEISLKKLFDNNNKNQIGYTFGFSAFDYLFENLTVNFEYTKILPFVYSNFIQTQTYTNHSYLLGHWIGGNADVFHSELRYDFLRGLSAKMWFQFVRKGEEGNSYQQYFDFNQPFLFGLKKYLTFLGAKVKYEWIHEFVTELEFNYIKFNTEKAPSVFTSDQNYNFYLSTSYGF